jgi:flagellar biosynthesis chaperone FliJ
MEPKRLRKILDISKRVEKARKGELSNARHEQNAALSQLEQARRAEREQLAALEESGELDVTALQDKARDLVFAAQATHKAREYHTEAGHEVARREAAAFDAVRDVRKFEILFDRADQERRLAQKNLEQQTLDETRRAPRKGI